VTSRR